MAAKIQDLINKTDASEIVRDKIAQILAEESASQQAIASGAALDPDLWKLRVMIETANPIDAFLNEPVTDKSPIVNVWFDSSNVVNSKSNTVSQQVILATFNIDIYGYGVAKPTAEGHQPGETDAAIVSQRGQRLVRNILMSGYYKNLDLKGVVNRRDIQSINAFQPEIAGQSEQKIQANRVSFNVEFIETAPEYIGQELEIIHVDIKRDTDGFVLAEAEYNYPTP